MDRCSSEGIGRQHRVRQQLVLCRSGKCVTDKINDKARRPYKKTVDPPHTTRIHIHDDMQKSTPTQIGNRFAVTAAHCLYDESKEEVLPSSLLWAC